VLEAAGDRLLDLRGGRGDVNDTAAAVVRGVNAILAQPVT
jgi:hypothetical protein